MSRGSRPGTALASAILTLVGAQLAPGGRARAAATVIAGPEVRGEFGAAVALGDVDRDGFADLVVGSPGALDGAGRVALFMGGPGGFEDSPAFVLDGEAGSRLGAALAFVGDFDADGRADFAVAAPDFSLFPGARGGRVIALRSTGSSPPLEALRVADGEAGARFGATLAGPGDVDGDGLSDLVIGAPDARDGAGFVALFLSAGPTFEPAARWSRDGAPGERLGARIERTWDVDGDRLADFVVVGAGAHLWHGAPTDGDLFASPVDPLPTAIDATAGAVGDRDGDGRADWIVVPPGASSPIAGGDRNADGVPDFVVVGVDGVTPIDGATLAAGAALDCTPCDRAAVGWGEALAAGDIDGDGRTDLVIGAPRFPSRGEVAGAVFAFLSPATVAFEVRASWPRSEAAIVRAIGDVDDDGRDELVRVGAEVVIIGADGERPLTTAVAPGPEGVAFADLDGDGGVDLVLAERGRVEVHWSNGAAPWNITSAAEVGVGEWVEAADVDADGLPDLLVGVSMDRGRAATWVFLGHATGFALDPDVVDRGGPFEAGARHPRPVGDLDGDSRIELLFGGAALATGQTIPPTTLAPLPVATRVEAAGDLDGDGRDDLLIDKPWAVAVGDVDRDGFADVAEAAKGEVAFGPELTRRASVRVGDLEVAGPIEAITPAGDVDGDGAADLLVTTTVRVHLVTAANGTRLAIAPRARDDVGLHTLQREVATRVPDRFRVEARRVSLTGLPLVALELAFAPSGSPLPKSPAPEALADPWVVDDPRVNARVATSKLPDGATIRWRARLRYDLATAPLQPTTPWAGDAIGPAEGFFRMRVAVVAEAIDDRYVVYQDGALSVVTPGLLGNDVGAPLDEVGALPLWVETEPVEPPARGTVLLLADGGFLYVPDRGAWGVDAFVYRVHDAAGNSDEARVDLDIVPVEACFGTDPVACRAGRLLTTLRRADGSALDVRCRFVGDGIDCDTRAVERGGCPAQR